MNWGAPGCLMAALAALSGCAPEGDVGRWSLHDAASADAADVQDDVDASGAGCSAADAADCGINDAGSDSALGDELVLTVTPGPTTSYFADGRSLPAGIYTLVYLDGCWKSGVVAWTVNLGGEGYNIVGGDPEQRLAMAPGTVGTFAGLGAYATYEECVAANMSRPGGITFSFGGGRLGLKLESLDPLTLFILLAGGETVGGRSPTFALRCNGTCR